MWRLVATLAGLSLVACDESEPPPRPPIAGSVSAFGSARRPDKTVYAESGGSRCVVYWTSATEESEREEILCPRELKAGERLRLTGRTCHRESPDPARQGPARCSPYMLYVDRALRAGGEGEYALEARSKGER